jgi:chemotaxis protein CheX
MQDKLSEVVIGSVHDVFLSFLSKEVFPGPVIDAVPCDSVQADVTAVVGFSGAINGSIHLRCPLVVALRLSSSMAGKPFDELKGGASDALGELVNLVANGVKSNLSDRGHIYLTPSMVMSGAQFGLGDQSLPERVQQTFQVDEDLFCVECAVKP